jgi:hypothetical protein
MGQQITAGEARLALDDVERRHQQVVDEIDVPRWYWLGLAVGWVVLGVIADLGHPWLTLGATSIFGAAHASISGWALSGRHRTNRVSVRHDVAGSRIAGVVVVFLLAMTAVTVGLALLANADGAGHPVTAASVVVAVAVACGGPNLTAAVRRRATR